ncbi:glycerol-3-phosphate responsive antiterminator [Cerasibacillus terrae]|uniref:Glycerol uptake operon antiterminator regulatory protein n=2 Tax=Cerasibacillus terrae TaxID=2498845 RepID=A0A5C8P0X2_9BACI|nr:glycerol-3-phosphate responsive antiterminator [Cerasibacillus terrae]
MKILFKNNLKKSKLIGAIKHPKSIDRAIKYKQNLAAVILMTGNILTIKDYVKVLQQEGLPVILHVEKIGGLHVDDYGMDFLIEYVKPFAIVTTKSNLINKAKSKGIFVIQRIFLIDTEVYDHLVETVKHIQPDIIEIMPCRVPDLLQKLSEVSRIPIITGGLLSTTKHAINALEHGAMAVTTSNTNLWKSGLGKH